MNEPARRDLYAQPRITLRRLLIAAVILLASVVVILAVVAAILARVPRAELQSSSPDAATPESSGAAQQRGGYTPTAAGAPSTDIWLAELGSSDGRWGVGAPSNITDRDGYDNQPAFEPGGTALLYTSARDAEQTDIYRYDLVAGVARRVTRTSVSEFSPTPLPGGGFSAIRESADGQLLWRYDGEGGAILPQVQPVGYHAWGDRERLVMFVLGGGGRPATLHLGNAAAGTAEVIAENPGRSLHKVPGQHALSFVRKITADDWWIEVLDLDSMEFTRWVATLAGREDYAWTPDRALIMGDGSKLYQARAGEDWAEIADLASTGVSGITRLAIDDGGTRIAIVANR
jgi:hypothetical protein